MKNAILKLLGREPDATEEEVNMNVQDKAPVELADVEATVAELATLKTSFAEQAQKLVEMQAALEAAQAALAEVEQVKAAAEATAAKEKADARMAKIVEAVGEAQAAALMEATKELNDTAFDAIVGAVATKQEVEAKSEMFTETGVDAPVKQDAEKKPVSFKNFTPKTK